MLPSPLLNMVINLCSFPNWRLTCCHKKIQEAWISHIDTNIMCVSETITGPVLALAKNLTWYVARLMRYHLSDMLISISQIAIKSVESILSMEVRWSSILGTIHLNKNECHFGNDFIQFLLSFMAFSNPYELIKIGYRVSIIQINSLSPSDAYMRR